MVVARGTNVDEVINKPLELEMGADTKLSRTVEVESQEG